MKIGVDMDRQGLNNKFTKDITDWETGQIVEWVKDYRKFSPYLDFPFICYINYIKGISELIKRIGVVKTNKILKNNEKEI